MLPVPQLQQMTSCLRAGKSKVSFPLSARIQPHVTSVARVDALSGCTSVFSAAARLCCGKPFPCTLCWGPPALTGTTGLCPASRAAGNMLPDDMAPSTPASQAPHPPPTPHRTRDHDTAVFSRAAPAGREAAQRTAQDKGKCAPCSDEIQPLLPQCCHRHPALCLLTSRPPQWGTQLQGTVCSCLRISVQIQFAGSKCKAVDEGFCSPSLLQSNPTCHPCSLHPLFQTLKPQAGKSCTEKAVSSSGCPALLGTEKGSQEGGGQQIPTRPRA